jgi:hypothetical protein
MATVDATANAMEALKVAKASKTKELKGVSNLSPSLILPLTLNYLRLKREIPS